MRYKLARVVADKAYSSKAGISRGGAGGGGPQSFPILQIGYVKELKDSRSPEKIKTTPGLVEDVGG